MFKKFTVMLWHFVQVSVGLLLLALVAAWYFTADIDYGDDARAFKVGNEGPHLFWHDGQWQLNVIRGSGMDGFTLQQQWYPHGARIDSEVYFPRDDRSFRLTIDGSRPDWRADGQFEPPPVHYADDQPIVAISDIESAYGTLRDFLVVQQVINTNGDWQFGQGHVVLLGDFTDRGPSVTQVLWFIFQLEQQALAAGGRVHYILGNHEIKNLQDNFHAADKKYQFVAEVLGKRQADLLGPDALLGRWLASKNVAELINGTLFVHGGLHPALAQHRLSLQQLNEQVRAQYRIAYYPKPAPDPLHYLVSTRDGVAWYRGYFDAELSHAQIQAPLTAFGASRVVVGHTPQRQVQLLHGGLVLAINVRQPRDYRGSFPPRFSQGARIDTHGVWRLLDDGSAELLTP